MNTVYYLMTNESIKYMNINVNNSNNNDNITNNTIHIISYLLQSGPYPNPTYYSLAI